MSMCSADGVGNFCPARGHALVIWPTVATRGSATGCRRGAVRLLTCGARSAGRGHRRGKRFLSMCVLYGPAHGIVPPVAAWEKPLGGEFLLSVTGRGDGISVNMADRAPSRADPPRPRTRLPARGLACGAGSFALLSERNAYEKVAQLSARWSGRRYCAGTRFLAQRPPANCWASSAKVDATHTRRCGARAVPQWAARRRAVATQEMRRSPSLAAASGP